MWNSFMVLFSRSSRDELRRFRGVRCSLDSSAKPQLSSVQRGVTVQPSAENREKHLHPGRQFNSTQDFWISVTLAFSLLPTVFCFIDECGEDFRGLPVTSALLPLNTHTHTHSGARANTHARTHKPLAYFSGSFPCG